MVNISYIIVESHWGKKLSKPALIDIKQYNQHWPILPILTYILYTVV